MTRPAVKTTEIVECDRCGKRVQLCADDTYRKHSYGRGIVCEKSGDLYARHMGEFTVTHRRPDGKATEWCCACRCGRVWLGPTYEDVEAQWGAHTVEGARDA